MKKLLVFVVGPTAIGKTTTAIDLATHFNTEIISCDSRQFYKEMNIGTAKPSSNEIKNLGEHPVDKKPIKVMKGQFGPYIKYKSINATIPDDKDPENITIEEALDLIEKRLAYDANKKGGKERKNKSVRYK